MSGLHSVTLHLDAALDPAQVAGFETVFSELLDAAATSHLRVDGGGWLIEALFTAPPSRAIIEELLAPCFAAAGLAARAAVIEPLAARDWLAENRAAFPPRRIGRFWSRRRRRSGRARIQRQKDAFVRSRPSCRTPPRRGARVFWTWDAGRPASALAP